MALTEPTETSVTEMFSGVISRAGTRRKGIGQNLAAVCLAKSSARV